MFISVYDQNIPAPEIVIKNKISLETNLRPVEVGMAENGPFQV